MAITTRTAGTASIRRANGGEQGRRRVRPRGRAAAVADVARARRTMRPVLAILAAAVAAAAAPAVAGAADVDRPFGLDRVDVTAAPGEANQVRVTDDGTGFVLIRDVVKLTETTPSCVSVSTLEVRCSAGSSTAVLVKPGDRDNRIEVVTRRQTESAKTRRRTQPGRVLERRRRGRP